MSNVQQVITSIILQGTRSGQLAPNKSLLWSLEVFRKLHVVMIKYWENGFKTKVRGGIVIDIFMRSYFLIYNFFLNLKLFFIQINEVHIFPNKLRHYDNYESNIYIRIIIGLGALIIIWCGANNCIAAHIPRWLHHRIYQLMVNN